MRYIEIQNLIIGKIINFRIITIPEGMVYVDGGDFSRQTKNKLNKFYDIKYRNSNRLCKPWILACEDDDEINVKSNRG